MANFHKDFPYGKGLWLWELSALLAKYGTVDAIVQKCKDNDINYVILKAGDGTETWDVDRSNPAIPQFTAENINKFHAQGIKVLGWAYVYGDNPIREADIAVWALDLGADGYVLDAESEYQGKPAQATQLVNSIKTRRPDKFLAYAPFPIIDSHPSYPYVEFGKVCDAVMPQIYWGEFKKSPVDALNWTFDNFSRWEAANPDSAKPMIPVGQAYDDAGVGFTLTPADLSAFISATAGYKSVNFWSMQHILRDDDWSALKNGKVNGPDIAQQPAPSQPTPPPSAPVPTVPEVPTPTEGATPVTPEPVTAAPAPEPPTTGVEVIPAPTQDGTKHIDILIALIQQLIDMLKGIFHIK
jgi:hypothetical protein